MDTARRGIITPEMKAVAAKEYRKDYEIEMQKVMAAVNMDGQANMDLPTPRQYPALPTEE